MTNLLTGLYNRSAALHNAYVKGFAYLGDGASFVAEKLKKPIQATQKALGKVAGYPLGALSRAAKSSLAKTVALKNRLCGRNRPEENDLALKAFRPEIIELNQKIKESLRTLSLSSSKLFDQPLLVGEIPSRRELQLLAERLTQMRDDRTLSPGHAVNLEKALSECRKLLDYPAEIENLKRRGVTEQDFEHFHKKIANNLIYRFTKDAILENLGEALGGKIVEEGFLLPDAFNPALIASSTLKTKIGLPLGRLAGIFTSVTGVYCLLEKLLSGVSKNTRRTVLTSLLCALVLLECFDLNPVSNFTKEFVGNQLGDFGFYSVSLLFNYAGMLAYGTQESLPDYVRKMTPSMMVYNGSAWMMTRMGTPGIIALPVAFYLSHVAYNSDVYEGFLKGRVLRQTLNTDLVRTSIYSKELVGGRALLTNYLLSALAHSSTDRALAHLIPINLPPMVSRNQLEQHARPFYASLTNGRNLDDATHLIEMILGQAAEGANILSPERREEIDLFLVSKRNELPYCEVSFLVREISDLLARLEDPEVAEIASAFLLKTLQRVRQTNSGNVHQQNADEWRTLRNRLTEALCDQEGVDLSAVTKLIVDQAEPHLESWMRTVMNHVEDLMDRVIKKLYPLAPSVSKEEEYCSLLLLNILAKVLIARVAYSFQRAEDHLTERLKPLSEEETSTFFKRASHLLFNQRHPVEQDGQYKAAYREGIHALVQHQF